MEKIPTLTKKDLQDLEQEKKRIFAERASYPERYEAWLRRKKNDRGDRRHVEFLGK